IQGYWHLPFNEEVFGDHEFLPAEMINRPYNVEPAEPQSPEALPLEQNIGDESRSETLSTKDEPSEDNSSSDSSMEEDGFSSFFSCEGPLIFSEETCLLCWKSIRDHRRCFCKILRNRFAFPNVDDLSTDRRSGIVKIEKAKVADITPRTIYGRDQGLFVIPVMKTPDFVFIHAFSNGIAIMPKTKKITRPPGDIIARERAATDVLLKNRTKIRTLDLHIKTYRNAEVPKERFQYIARYDIKMLWSSRW
ncbi:hypothetical protein ILUMI_10694, partial [Ignelater luminosus]